MDFLKQNMMPILAGVVLLGGIYVYMTYFSSPSQPAALTSSDDAALSQNLLITLQNLHTIKLDNAIFSDPAFTSLTDFGVIIPPQTPGRRNPFAPFDSTAPAAGGAGSVNITLPKTGK